MSSVSVSDLKANLSRYLREVRRGGEIQVLDRGNPVARLVPPAIVGDGHRERLISAGVLRPGEGDSAAILQELPLELQASLSEALDQDRADRLCGTGTRQLLSLCSSQNRAPIWCGPGWPTTAPS